MTEILNMEGYLLTKVFDSVDHYFLLAILEKYGFKKNFLRWIETLLNNQESFIINGGNDLRVLLSGKCGRKMWEVYIKRGKCGTLWHEMS